jgi:hypothetical protein
VKHIVGLCVLGTGLFVRHRIQINPEQSGIVVFVDAPYSVVDVHRWFRVPVHLLSVQLIDFIDGTSDRGTERTCNEVAS